ncbi:MAG: 50S ribosomal protein L32 [Deltaproteobacteria bacterium]|nr:50S ribosomal protein L32 [Deltaproteobacteria bacterium]
MPVPKRKTSKSRKKKRQTHWKTSAPAVTTCPECGEIKEPHRACPECGSYKGRTVVEPSED